MAKPEVQEDDGSAGLVGSVVQAVAVLRHVGNARDPEGVTSIARAVSISPSSCFNILRTLVAEGFLERDPASKTYTLGLAPLDLARRAIDENGAFSYLRQDMQRLADAYSVTTTLWRLARSERWVLVGMAESHALARIHLTIGQRLPKFGGAMGRCVAAHSRLQQHELVGHFKSLRWYRPPTVEEYLTQVAETGERGWGLDVSQFLQFTSVASPVIDRDDRIRFCITQTMFADQLSPTEMQELGRSTLQIASSAARHLHGRTAPLGVSEDRSKRPPLDPPTLRRA